METNDRRNRAAVRLTLIILLGLGIRIAGLWWGQGYFYIGSGDALEAYSAAVDYARGEPTAQYLGQPNYNEQAKLPGPLWSLFCFMGLRAWGSIDGAILGIVLLNTGAIYICYLLAERTLGAPASTWTALLAATLPYVVYYSVSLYNPNVMPFLGGLMFLALWEVIRRDHSRWIFWVVALLLIMPQFHLCVTMLLPAVGLVLVLSSARLNVPWLLGGVLAGAVFYVPYIRGEMSHGWHNTLGMISAPGRFGFGGLKALSAPLSLLTNWVPQWTGSTETYLQLGRACFGWAGIFLALNVLSAIVAVLIVLRVAMGLGAAMRGFWQAPRQVFNRSRGLLFLGIVTTIPLLCAAISGKNFRSHYAIVLFAPLLALAGGAVATRLPSRYLGRWFGSALIVVTCANSWFMPAMFHYQAVRIDQGETFVPSFRNFETVYQRLKAHAGPERCVRVDDGEFGQEVQARESWLSDAMLISRYVTIREKECAVPSGRQLAPVTYTLRRAGSGMDREPAVAYRAHGIELIAAPDGP